MALHGYRHTRDRRHTHRQRRDRKQRAAELWRTLNRAEAEAEGWFHGPPYAVAESVFDEHDIEGCSLEAEEECE